MGASLAEGALTRLSAVRDRYGVGRSMGAACAVQEGQAASPPCAWKDESGLDRPGRSPAWEW